MTYTRAYAALSKARDDYQHAINALFDATTERSRHRHARRAKVAQGRIADARRDMARLACDLEDMAA